MKTENGKAFESAFKILGINVKFVDEAISPQLATYYFNYLNIKQYNKKTLQNVVDKMSFYYHIKFDIVNSDIAHFGLSMPIKERRTLWLSDLEQPKGDKINIGKDLANKDVVLDFAKLSHLLVAGTTGSGKSVLLKSMMYSLYASLGWENFELVIIDPKRTEFQMFNKLANVKYIDETTDAIATLNDLVYVMEDRYKQMANGIHNFKHLFVVVDELADLMLSSRYDVEETIVRLAQKSRAAKIHLILATQRPTVNVITGLIKANMPNRICLKMPSSIDSCTMLGHKGAEQLLGFGDGIIKLDNSIDENRFQCAMISDMNLKRALLGEE